MNGTTFIKAFREETMDGVQPYLWSDPLILRYLDEAQVEFCRKTEGIEDAVSSLCTISAAMGEPVVRMSRQIQKVRAATLVELGRPLDLLSVEEARGADIPPGSTRMGVPRAMVLGVAPGRAQLYPAPSQDFTVHLDVFRLPLKSIETAGDEIEVDRKHAPLLMQYVLSRAYARPDPDTMDRVRSDYFNERFLAGCADAKREQGRARKPGGATQFSW